MRPRHHLRTWLRRQPDWLFDGAIALCAVVVKLSVLPTAPADAPFRASPAVTAAAIVLSLAGAVALVWRRRVPGRVLVVVALSSVGVVVLGLPNTGFALVVALYSVAAYAPRRESLASLAVSAALTAMSLVLADEVEFAAVSALVFVSAWVLGDQRRTQRDRTTALERRGRDLELQRAVEARLAVVEERERIAGELHDLLAHSIAEMVTQGVAAERCISVDHDRATAALLAVERTGRQSLGELRRLLGLLREGRDGERLAPQPGFDDLPALIALFHGRGLPVRLVVKGDSHPLPTVVGLSAYRIVQAALDNVLAHAGPVPTTVTLDFAGPELVLSVVDDGPRAGTSPADHRGADRDAAGAGHEPAGAGSEPAGVGRGVPGMRERAALVGGTVHAAAAPGGGFAVRACLPAGEPVR